LPAWCHNSTITSHSPEIAIIELTVEVYFCALFYLPTFLPPLSCPLYFSLRPALVPLCCVVCSKRIHLNYSPPVTIHDIAFLGYCFSHILPSQPASVSTLFHHRQQHSKETLLLQLLQYCPPTRSTSAGGARISSSRTNSVKENERLSALVGEIRQRRTKLRASPRPNRESQQEAVTLFA